MDWIQASEILQVESDGLEAIVKSARLFLEPKWKRWHRERYDTDYKLAKIASMTGGGVEIYKIPEKPSTGMAKFSSAFLCSVLNQMYGHRWVVAAGLPQLGVQKGGILGSGGWSEHYWCLHKGILLDITADQHGHPVPVVTYEDDRRYVRNMKAADLRVHLRDNSKRVDQWVNAWSKEIRKRGIQVR